jgi:hypothetical protein
MAAKALVSFTLENVAIEKIKIRGKESNLVEVYVFQKVSGPVHDTLVYCTLLNVTNIFKMYQLQVEKNAINTKIKNNSEEIK